MLHTYPACAAMFTAALTVPGLRRAKVLLPNAASEPRPPEQL